MAAVRVLFGRMGLAAAMLLLGLGAGAVLWANQADAGVSTADAAYTAVTPCVVFDSRLAQGATGIYAGPLNGGQAVTYQVTGAFPIAQGGGNTTCGVPAGATSVEINVVAVNALNEGNLRVTDGSPSSTGGVVNYNKMTPKLNTANAVIVPLNASGQLVVNPNCGPDCAADTTEVRGVVLGYFSTALAQRVAALETLLAGVTRTTHNGYATLRFNHVNLWLTNGSGTTYTGNGYGNLIVGYDTNPAAFARTGSHNIVVGPEHGWTGSGGVVFGERNRITASAATVTGGSENTAGGYRASVSGGEENSAAGINSTVTGGLLNQAPSYLASVTGGSANTAGGQASTVSGGTGNTASGGFSAVSGGESRTVNGIHDWRAGGLFQDF